MHSSPEWNKKLAEVTAEVSKSISCLVCGPKGSGKSTFSRFLTNRLLTSQSSSGRRTRSSKIDTGVIVLDLDPGQSEFCPPGTLSLVLVQRPNFLPPFGHPWPDNQSATLVRCHALASVNPGTDTDLFIEIALDLYSHYQHRYNGYPLIINTPGWILGTGLDLLALLISNIRPTEVLYMSEEGPAETVEGLRAACKSSSFTTLPSQQSDPGARKSATHFRAMQTMAYFHVEKRSGSQHLSINSSPLSAIPPWRVSYAGKRRGIAGLLCYGAQLESALLAEAINGMVLAVVEIEDERAFRQTEPSSPDEESMEVEISDSEKILQCADRLISYTPEGIPYIQQTDGGTLDVRYCRTVGLVLVRGVDVENSSLQLLTPIPLSKLEEIRQNGRHIVLVHGQFDTPTWAYTEDLYERASGQEDDTIGDDLLNNEDDEENDGGVIAGGLGADRPWVEGVDSNRRRQVGGGTWRVRRDLGRQTK